MPSFEKKKSTAVELVYYILMIVRIPEKIRCATHPPIFHLIFNGTYIIYRS